MPQENRLHSFSLKIKFKYNYNVAQNRLHSHLRNKQINKHSISFRK